MAADLAITLLLIATTIGLMAALWPRSARCLTCGQRLTDPEGAYCSQRCIDQSDGTPRALPEAGPSPRAMLGREDGLILPVAEQDTAPAIILPKKLRGCPIVPPGAWSE